MTDSSDPLKNLPLVIEPHATKRAAGWQIALTALGFVAILTLFFFGINHQRDETAGEQTAATMPTPVAPGGEAEKGQQQVGQQPQQQQQQQPSTTGQGSGEKSNDQNGHAGAGGQKTNTQPADGNGQPAQHQSK